MKSLLKKYSHAWLLGYAFIYLPWFMYLEKTVTSNYHIMYIALDDLIPFNEYFIIPYLLWFFYVAGAIGFFFLTDVKSYYKLCTMLFTGMTISLMICTVFPNGTDFRPVIDPSKIFLLRRFLIFMPQILVPTSSQAFMCTIPFVCIWLLSEAND